MRRVSAILIVAIGAFLAPVVLAEEIVHFTNSAEMTVRSHVVEKDMVKLDLGSNNFITFPLSMVDKIVSAGKNVYLNPAYHPANQALPPTAGELPTPIPDRRAIRGAGKYAGYQPGTGMRLGEASNAPQDDANSSSGMTTSANGRPTMLYNVQPRRYDPLNPGPVGTRQTIAPPGADPAPRGPVQIQIRADSLPATPPPAEPQSAPPAEAEAETPPQDPPESD